MKKNNNMKVTKIKNYLNAISKWIKNHIKYILFGLVSCIYLFMCFAIYCKKNEETAFAYEYETSENYILEFPNINIGYTSLNTVYYGYTLPFYIVPKNDSIDLIICNNNLNEYISYTIYLEPNSNFYEVNISRFYIKYYSSRNNIVNIADSSSTISFFFDYDTFNLDYNPKLFFETIKEQIYMINVSVSPSLSTIDYLVVDSDNNILIGITVHDVTITGNSINSSMYFNYFYTTNAFTPEQTQFYIDYGYNLGYEDGLRTTWEDISPFQVVINGAVDFLNTNLFGNFSIMDLIKVGGGALLLIIMLKFFMGG